jgi:hypothetical protein
MESSKNSTISLINKFKGNDKSKLVVKPSTKALKPTGGVTKEGKCLYCGKIRHWKQNCPKYLKDKKNEIVASTSVIFVIEISMSTSTSWILNAECGSHICTDVQELRMSEELAKGKVDLRVGNGAKVAALAVGIYILILHQVVY